MNAVVKPSYLTISEFLEWENQQDTRHELLDGQIVAMTGGTAHAGLIVSIAARLFRGCLKTKYLIYMTVDLAFTQFLAIQAG